MESTWLRKTVLFITSQTLSLFGVMLTQLAIGWHIVLVTKSGEMLALAAICGFAPQIVISLFAGAWSDRFDRKKLLIFTNSLLTVSTVLLALLLTLGYDMLWLLFVALTIRSFGTGILTPAAAAFLPDIVPEDKLMRTNGILAGAQGLMMFTAPAAAGWLYENIGIRAAFWAETVFTVAVIVLLCLIKVDKQCNVNETAESEKPRVLREIADGLRYAAKTKWLRQLLLFYLAVSLLFGPMAFLTPLMVALSFGEEPWRLVAHETVFAAGFVAGGLMVRIFAARFRNKVKLVVISCGVIGIVTLALGFSASFIIYLVIMTLVGTAAPFMESGLMTCLQQKVNPEFMGRVFSFVSVIFAAAAPLSMAVYGPAADVVGVEFLLKVSGVLIILAAVFAMFLKEMIKSGEV